MRITLYVIGSLKEAYWRQAEEEYKKRFQNYAKLEIVECPDYASKEGASLKEQEAVKEKESEKILAKIKPNDYVILLDLHQKEYESEAWSEHLMRAFEKGGSHLSFVIGGSLGLSESLKKRGNESFTLSQLTFPHQMVRIILLEQLYRAFKIAHHEPYHK